MLFEKYRMLIFTLNYDLVIEEYAKRIGEELYDGFNECQEFDAKLLDNEIENNKHILAHMHGSVLFANHSLNKLVKHKTPQEALCARLESSMFFKEQNGKLFILSPIISGTEKYSAIKSTPVLFNYMEKFKELSQNVNRILVIGYGGNDVHVNKYLDDRLSNDESRELRIAYVTKVDNPLLQECPPPEVLLTFPRTKNFSRKFGSGWDWISNDNRIVVRTTGFPLCSADMCLLTSHFTYDRECPQNPGSP